MNPRTKYTMTQADLDELMAAGKPTPAIMLHLGGMSSPQENANRAWAALGKRMGFDSMTVEPDGSDVRCFTAVPTETEPQRIEREKRQADEAKAREIEQLKNTIAHSQVRLDELTK